jgi:hypothetical protein
MFESIGRSWGIVTKSFGVLMEEKQLLLFPALSGIAMLLLLASFILPVFLLNDTALAIPLLFMFYFGAYFIVIFFNTALVHAAGNKLDSKEVSVMGSISFAFSRLANIIGWALFSATVGLALGLIRSQSRNRGIGGVIAGIAASIIGVAWSFATFLVVPVMVFENAGPISALKRSVELLKSTWTEQAWGGLGISGIVLLLYLPAIGAGILVYVLGGFGPLLLLLPALIIYVAMVFVMQGALEGIFTTEIYRYAATGKAAVFKDVLQQGRVAAPAPQAPPSQL